MKELYTRRWNEMETKADKREWWEKTWHEDKMRGKERGGRMERDNDAHRDRKRLT